MTTIYMSNKVQNATSLETVVELVNDGTCEGVEGVEFTSEQLAGCYAYNAAKESGERVEGDLEAHLEFLAEAGAEFNSFEALNYAEELDKAEIDD